jgi:hypothetical protein
MSACCPRSGRPAAVARRSLGVVTSLAVGCWWRELCPGRGGRAARTGQGSGLGQRGEGVAGVELVDEGPPLLEVSTLLRVFGGGQGNAAGQRVQQLCLVPCKAVWVCNGPLCSCKVWVCWCGCGCGRRCEGLAAAQAGRSCARLSGCTWCCR